MVSLNNAVHNTVDAPFYIQIVVHYSLNYPSIYPKQYYQTSYKISFSKQ